MTDLVQLTYFDETTQTEKDCYPVVAAQATRNIGEIVASTIPLTDAGLHLLDGALIQGRGIYSAFYDYMVTLWRDGYTQLFWGESDWQSYVTNHGVCGKFVLDEANRTVRLPKVTGIIEGTTDVNALGDLVQAGLPNITGYVNKVRTKDTDLPSGGAFQSDLLNSNLQNYWEGARNTNAANISFDASRSSSIYGNSSTVQPQTIKVLYYIVIANSTKTDIQVDIDNIATDVNGKADTDLTNCTNVANIKMAHNAMPSNTYVALTFSHGASYTAPADGYFSIIGYGGGAGTIMALISPNIAVGSTTINNTSAAQAYIYLPVKKGTVVNAYQYNGTVSALRFYYAVGSESEV